MKRTFIPPKYRPYVRGSELKIEQNQYLHEWKNPRKRREFILNLVQGKKEIHGIDLSWAASILIEIFPNLKELLKQKENVS